MVKDKFKNFYYFLVKFIATGGFVGKSKIAPGTLGSLVGIALTVSTYLILIEIKPCVQSNCQTNPLFWVIYLLILSLIGLICTKVYITKFNTKDSDPKEVVIDEIIGMAITMVLCFPKMENEIIYSTLTFVLFRIFDILKPWPINYIDKNIKGAAGIILDDVVASLFASISYYSILLLKS